MQVIDILLIALLVLSVIWSVRHIRKRRGSCCGDCASCGRACTRQKQESDPSSASDTLRF